MKRYTVMYALGVAALAAVAGCGDAAQSYVTTEFGVPLEVSVPEWLPREPAEDSSNFLTWVGEGTQFDRAVRFLVPVTVYPPGGTGPTAVPSDYISYLRSQAEHGGRFEDESTVTFGDRPAHIVTATTDTSLDGSLGCPSESMDAHDCMGLQPGMSLRLAVVDIDGTTVLAWARVGDGSADGGELHADFEDMLESVELR